MILTRDTKTLYQEQFKDLFDFFCKAKPERTSSACWDPTNYGFIPPRHVFYVEGTGMRWRLQSHNLFLLLLRNNIKGVGDTTEDLLSIMHRKGTTEVLP
jgi:hypothetical protein